MARADRCDGGRAAEGDTALSDDDTIVALSSGAPPAAIAIIRVSGPEALSVAAALAGKLPAPRRAALRALRDADGDLLDRALVLVFPGPDSATGEDLVELHCHGGRAVVAAVEDACRRAGARGAAPGEFTRRALLNGRIDLAQAQGLADLLEAQSEAERRLAIAATEGAVGQAIRGWMRRLTDLAAELEASIDYGEEGDVVAEGAALRLVLEQRDLLVADIRAVLAMPPVERWRDGWRVVLTGPPNAGKSTLLNLLAGRDAAIVADTPGTTRDSVEVPVQRNGIGYVLIDTAGLRDATNDPIERLGIARARDAAESADLTIWLDDLPPPSDELWVFPRLDEAGRTLPPPAIGTRRDDHATIERLWLAIEGRLQIASTLSAVALHTDQRRACREAVGMIETAYDVVLLAEGLRAGRRVLASVLGIDSTSDLLDSLFQRFCVGK